ncbi:MAG: O-antigen ligase family protein [Fusobacteriota bacterium]
MKEQQENKLIDKKISVIMEYIDVIGIIIFGLSLFTSRAGMNIGMGLILISFLIKLIFDRKNLVLSDKISNYLLFIYIGGAFWNIFSDNGITSFLFKFENQYRLITVLLLINTVTNNKKLKKFLISIEISFIISITYGIINWYRLDEGRLESFGGCMTYAHPLALALVIHLGLIFSEKNIRRKILFIILEMLGLGALILTQTRGAWLGFIGGTVIFFIALKKYKFLLAFGIILMSTFFLMPENFQNRVKSITATRENSSNNARLNLWGAAIWTYKNNPIFGSGEGNNDKWYNMYKEKKEMEKMNIYGGNTHNMYLHFLSQNGLLIIVYLYFLFYIIPKDIILNLKKSKDKEKIYLVSLGSGVISFYISGLTENVWYHLYPGYAILTVFFLITYINRRENKK